MSLRGFLIVIICQHKNNGCVSKLIGAKKGRTFQFNLFLGPFCIYYIPHNYVIPQTHSFFYPHRLSFVESIRNFVHTDRTGSYCNGGLHSLFTSCSGLRSVLLDFFMIRKCCGNEVAVFAKLSHVNLCTYSDRWKYVSGSSKFGERFPCRSHILALIFVDL